MKKIFTVTLAAVCALSAAMFGLSACGGDANNADSDVVTESEWAAAMAVENLYNVTIAVSNSYSKVATDASGNSSTSTEKYSGEIKIGLSDDGRTGNTYEYFSAVYTDEETWNATTTMYEVLTADSYSYVQLDTEEGYSDYWDGYKSSSVYSRIVDDLYMMDIGIIGYTSSYSEFEYVDGAYTRDDSADYYYADEEEEISWSTMMGYTFSDVVYVTYIKINDGCLSSFVKEYSAKLTYTDGSCTADEYYRYEYTFSDYGTTSVEVPEEYTYDYYKANK